MIERLLFFHAGKFRVKACSFYDITRKGRKGVRLTCLRQAGTEPIETVCRPKNNCNEKDIAKGRSK